MRTKNRLNGILKCILIFFVIANAFAMTSFAEENNAAPLTCDRTVGLATSVAWLNSVAPGQTVCVEGGQRNVPLVLANMNGTPEAPIKVINTGGVVEVNANAAWTSALDIRSSKHFKLTGTGDAGSEYGFRVGNSAAFGFGLSANRGSSHYTIENIEVMYAGFAGFMLRSDPGSGTNRPDFVQKNTIVRNNYIHHVSNEATDGGYGMMIGISTFGANPAVHEIQGLRVYNNTITDSGRNAMHISGATDNVRVYENSISNYGTSNLDWFDNGIYIGPGTTGDFYNNIIANGSGETSGAGINNQGKGNLRIFNNLIIEPGAYGIISPAEAQYIYADDPVFAGNQPTHILYNTIIHPSIQGNGLFFRDSNSSMTGNTVGYNLIVHRSTGNSNYLRIDDPAYDLTDPSNNYGTNDIAQILFNDVAANDYTLQNSSPAQGYGFDPGMDAGQDPGFDDGTFEPDPEPDPNEDPGIDPDYVPDPVVIDCDASIPSNNVRLWNGAEMGVQPGDTVCIESGIRPEILHLTNFHGTAEEPVIFINHGGIVAIKTDRNNSVYNGMYALKITAASHFILEGTGDRNAKYGFRLSTGGNSGANTLVATTNSTDFTIANVEIFGAGFAGIMLKTDPSCTSPNTTQRPTEDIQPGFVQKNTIVRDNFVHNTGGEGMYIGHYAYALGYNTSCGVLWPHALEGLEVYNNVIVDTQLDSLQISSATQGVKVYNNHLENYGLAEELYHTNGLEINPGTSGEFYNNIIKGGKGAGINYKGRGDARIFNNLIIEPMGVGIISLSEAGMSNPNDPVFDGAPIHIMHNTIVNSGEIGIDFWNRGDKNAGNTAYNNLIVREDAVSASGNEFIRLRYADTDLTHSNNYTTNDLSAVNFVDAANGNYSLQSASPAIDYGKDISMEGLGTAINKDFYGMNRPSGAGYDAGALERQHVEFLTRTVEYQGEERKYAVYLPENYDPSMAWPMIVFHHGVGETGTDGVRQTEVGIGPAIGNTPELQQAIIYMPQRAGKSSDEAKFWTEQAQRVAEEFNVDPERWYMTGLSAGGYITWNWGGTFADQYAALMPLSGGLSDKSESKLSRLATLPIRAIHGGEDNVIALSWGSQAAVDAVNGAGGNAILTVLEGVGHSEWDTKFYSVREHMQWLLAQRNNDIVSFKASVKNQSPGIGEEIDITLQFSKEGYETTDFYLNGVREVTVSGYETRGSGSAGTAGTAAGVQMRGESIIVELTFNEGAAIIPLRLINSVPQELVFEVNGIKLESSSILVEPVAGRNK